jgi:hypothetical protein
MSEAVSPTRRSAPGLSSGATADGPAGAAARQLRRQARSRLVLLAVPGVGSLVVCSGAPQIEGRG